MMLTADQLIELEIAARDLLEALAAKQAQTDTEPIAPDKAIGRLSRLDAMQIQEVAKEAKRRREQRMAELQDALYRMDVGKYGRCENCREWICYERLEAQPEVRFCGDCRRSA
jgi:DnaK suppressor protein